MSGDSVLNRLEQLSAAGGQSGQCRAGGFIQALLINTESQAMTVLPIVCENQSASKWPNNNWSQRQPDRCPIFSKLQLPKTQDKNAHLSIYLVYNGDIQADGNVARLPT